MNKRIVVIIGAGCILVIMASGVVWYGRSAWVAFNQPVADTTSPGVAQSVPASIFEPRIAPNGGTFYDSVQVTLGDARPHSSLRYTTDGTDPLHSSTAQVYTGTFTLRTSATVKTSPDLADATSTSGATAKFTIVPSASVTWHDVPAPNGSDDTAAIQAVLNGGGNIRFGKGTYIVGPIFVASDSVLQLSSDTVLQAKSGGFPNETDSLLNIADKNNVTIYGNNGRIEMLKQEYTTGEWRMGVNIVSSQNIYIEALASNSSGGDGFWIGAERDRAKNPSMPLFCSDIVLAKVSADNNRRTGLAISSVQNVTITDSSFTRTNGTPTQSGIDIEPDGKEYSLQGILFENITTQANEGNGISLALSKLSGSGKFVDITIRKHQDTGSLSGLLLTKLKDPLAGQITIEDAVWSQPERAGFVADNYNVTGPRVDVVNTTVVDPYTPRKPSTATGKTEALPRYAAAYHVQWYTTAASPPSSYNISFDHPTVKHTTTTQSLHGFAFSINPLGTSIPKVDTSTAQFDGIADDAKVIYPPANTTP